MCRPQLSERRIMNRTPEPNAVATQGTVLPLNVEAAGRL
jgi:hypothetical protein